MSVRKGAVFCAVFAFGVAAGMVFFEQILPILAPVVKMGISAAEHVATGVSSPVTALAIFAKNASVALLCVLTGKPTKGLFPATVCAINGVVIGFLGILLRDAGFPLWKYAVLLSPHGMIELPAIFASCALGMATKNVLERVRTLPLPLAALAVASAVETWVSPAVGKFIS